MGIIKYVIADDHKIFRQGVRMALADDPLLHCVGEAGNGLELLELLHHRPDVVLLDLKMPEMDGMETLAKIRETDPVLKVIVITMYEDKHFILHMMEAGANGYLIKNAEPDEIKLAIHAAAANGYYFNDHVSTVMLKTIMQPKDRNPSFKEAIQLTGREADVLRHLCEGDTAAEIGKKIFLSARTVEGIKAGMMEKVGVKNTAGLIMYAVKSGVVE